MNKTKKILLYFASIAAPIFGMNSNVTSASLLEKYEALVALADDSFMKSPDLSISINTMKDVLRESGLSTFAKESLPDHRDSNGENSIKDPKTISLVIHSGAARVLTIPPIVKWAAYTQKICGDANAWKFIRYPAPNNPAFNPILYKNDTGTVFTIYNLLNIFIREIDNIKTRLQAPAHQKNFTSIVNGLNRTINELLSSVTSQQQLLGEYKAPQLPAKPSVILLSSTPAFDEIVSKLGELKLNNDDSERIIKD